MAIDPVVWNEWYPLAVTADLEPGRTLATRLLGHAVAYRLQADGTLAAWAADDPAARYATRQHCATHWVCLGTPPAELFAVPEMAEPDRRVVGAGSMTVHASGLRVVENFLDMAHFPYVHDGYLGAEPYTDVEPYTVGIEADGELYARECRFYQPRGAATAQDGGGEAQYIYRVARPFVAFLYKTNPVHTERMDVIGLFVQPLAEDWCKAHTVLLYADDHTPDHGLRLFQQTIFGQDLMILSNEVPRTLPLDTRFEMPVRADAMSVAYRRWLSAHGVHYGTYQPGQPEYDAAHAAVPA